MKTRGADVVAREPKTFREIMVRDEAAVSPAGATPSETASASTSSEPVTAQASEPARQDAMKRIANALEDIARGRTNRATTKGKLSAPVDAETQEAALRALNRRGLGGRK